MLAPLFREYETTIQSQKTEITSLRFELQKSLDYHKQLQDSNEQLLAELTQKTKEYLKYINDHKDLPQSVGDDEAYQRKQLLTEENQVLFEQITLLRAHTDHLISEYQVKTEAAT